jgi:predicted DNA-binding ribbon-helix-helix protein
MEIRDKKTTGNLSSAIRVYVYTHAKQQLRSARFAKQLMEIATMPLRS